MRCGSGNLRELVSRFLAHADACLPALCDEPNKPVIVALGRNQNIIEAALAGPQRLGDRVHTVQNIHITSVDGPR